MDYGDIVQLGRHRLMCGDATNRKDIEALLDGAKVDLVLTDPPYGIDVVNSGGFYKGHWGKRAIPFGHNPDDIVRPHPEILGDKDTSAARKHYNIIKHFTNKHIIWGAQHFGDFLPQSNGWIVWDKKPTIKNYSACEMAYTSLINHNVMYEQRLSGFIREGSRKFNPSPRVHPTQKPVELHMHILQDFTKVHDVVLDCFGGSGTTLIACELTGRACLMMELSPDYCDIIKERYKKLVAEQEEERK